MAGIPNSYKDDYWKKLASDAEQRAGIPGGLLQGVLLKGERSNNDQVSEAGAKSPFQIIPKTRDAVLKKYGIDAYLSPENAAEAAAQLLKESLKRNNNDQALAIAEYHGGTDRKNWGPKTKNYVARVTGEPTQSSSSTYDQVKAERAPKAEPVNAIANIYAAYASGKMSSEEAAQFEQDVQNGDIILPRGKRLSADATPAKSVGMEPGNTTPESSEIPMTVLQAYNTGKMDKESMAQLESDIKSGAATLPKDTEIKTPQTGIINSITDAFTGNARETKASNSGEDWVNMPEFSSLSMANFKTSAGTMLAGNDEIAKIVKANHPDVQVSQDEQGNYLFKSAIDGKTYPLKPGFQWSDVPRMLGGVAAFTPAGKAASLVGMGAAAGGTQAVIEASQAAAGGEFNPGDVATAGAMGAVVPGVLGVVGRAAKGVVSKLKTAFRGAPELPPGAVDPLAPPVIAAQADAPVAPGAAQVDPPVNPAVTPEPAAPTQTPTMQSDELAGTMRKASAGNKKSEAALADEVRPDAEVLAAAKRLGIEEYLQPDHVSTNQVFREMSQAIKSMPGSEARAAELKNYESIGKKADEIIEKLGGTDDLSTLNSTVKSNISSTIDELEAQAKAAYSDISEKIPPTTPASAQNVLTFIRDRAFNLGGEKNLTAQERGILSKLDADSPPTYALLDDVRKTLTAARVKREGEFKDAPTGLIKKLEFELMKDQRLVLESAGMGEEFKSAQRLVAIRKGLEDDITALMGRNLDKSIVQGLSTSIKKLAAGDSQSFIGLIKKIPENMRQEVTASGLNLAFGKTARTGQLNFSSYAAWFEGLQKNKQSYDALFLNLPKEARQSLTDLYKVSRSISLSSRERITTGRLNSVLDKIKGPDTLVSNIYDVAKRSALGAATEVITTPIGLPGAGVAASISSALQRGKPNALKAADALISSPEFSQAVAKAAKSNDEALKEQIVEHFISTKAFKRFLKEINSNENPTETKSWVLKSLQIENNVAKNDSN